MDTLREMTVHGFIELLQSDAPAPGGGSAAALAGAQGAALGAMVAALTVGKKKYLEYTDAMNAAGEALRSLAAALMLAVDRDTQAFDALSAAMKLPKETDAEKALRSAEMQRALKGAIQSPMEILRRSLDALGEIETMLGKFNVNTASDLGTGAAMLRAAAQGAWLNILINAGALRDANERQALLAEGRALHRQALTSADSLFEKIEDSLLPDA